MFNVSCIRDFFYFRREGDFLKTFIRPIRKQWNDIQEVSVDSEWFKVYRLNEDVYAFYEPYHQEEVISYLILGSQKALLWDTGMGVDRLRPVVESLWKYELIVLNSHTHYDHIGSNAEFDNVIALNHPQSINELDNDIKDGWESLFTEELIADDAPTGYINDSLQFRRCSYTLMDTCEFDLGGRILKWIKAPGHANNHTMLVDDKHKLVFVADGYYPGLLYALEGYDLKQYYQTMKMLAEEYYEYRMICSHNEPYAGMEKAEQFKEMLKDILDNVLHPTLENGYEYYKKGELRLVVKPHEK